MKYKNRIEKLFHLVKMQAKEKTTIDDVIEKLRPMLKRYAEVATVDRQEGKIQRWQGESCAFIVAAYCTYLRDGIEVPPFVDELLEKNRIRLFNAGTSEKYFLGFLSIVIKIIAPEVFDFIEKAQGSRYE